MRGMRFLCRAIAAAGLCALPMAGFAAVTSYPGSSSYECAVGTTCPPTAEGDANQLAVPNGGGARAARVSFLSGLTNLLTEEFTRADLFAGFDPKAILGGNGEISGGVFQTTSVDSGQFLGRWNTTAPNQGDSGGWYENVLEGTPIEITLDSARRAVGFYLTDLGDFDSEVRLMLDGVDVGQIKGPGASQDANGNVTFYGVRSDAPFKKISLSFVCPPTAQCGEDVLGLDSLVVGDIADARIPEPASVLLAALGLLGAGAASRRRRS